jgi:hypothetical protein
MGPRVATNKNSTAATALVRRMTCVILKSKDEHMQKKSGHTEQ